MLRLNNRLSGDGGAEQVGGQWFHNKLMILARFCGLKNEGSGFVGGFAFLSALIMLR